MNQYSAVYACMQPINVCDVKIENQHEQGDESEGGGGGAIVWGLA